MADFDELSIIIRIRQLMTAHNWSVYKLATKSGISYPTLNNSLTKPHIPSIMTLSKICDAFEISLSDFFDCDLFSTTKKDKDNYFLRIWNMLSPEDKKLVLNYMSGLAHILPFEKSDFNDL